MMRVIAGCVLALAGMLAGCRGTTEPDMDALIVFRVDTTCREAGLFYLFIDGETVGSRVMAPGDTASFNVRPGSHNAGAAAPTVEGTMALWFPRVVTLAPGQRYTQTLGCG